MDFRREIMENVAFEIGALVLEESCSRCQSPLLARKDQGYLPFCWGCVTDKRTAVEGYALLLKARLAEKGFEVYDDAGYERRHQYDPWEPAERSEAGPLGVGMPL